MGVGDVQRQQMKSIGAHLFQLLGSVAEDVEAAGKHLKSLTVQLLSQFAAKSRIATLTPSIIQPNQTADMILSTWSYLSIRR